jgi:hypothetical protein
LAADSADPKVYLIYGLKADLVHSSQTRRQADTAGESVVAAAISKMADV